MPSAARLAANRANARRSTGPRTADGKRRSSMNALVHGVYAEMRVVTDADRAALGAILAAVIDDFRPVGRYETRLARRLAEIWWRLGRALEAETRLMTLVRREGAENAFRATLREIRALDRVGRLEFRLQEALIQVEQLLARRQALRKRMGKRTPHPNPQGGRERPNACRPVTPSPSMGKGRGGGDGAAAQVPGSWLRSVKKITAPAFSTTYAHRFGASWDLPAVLDWLESRLRKPPLTLSPGMGTMRA